MISVVIMKHEHIAHSHFRIFFFLMETCSIKRKKTLTFLFPNPVISSMAQALHQPEVKQLLCQGGEHWKGAGCSSHGLTWDLQWESSRTPLNSGLEMHTQSCCSRGRD